MILKALDGYYMPEWAKGMAETVARHKPICTADPDLQSFLGRDKVETRFWHEPYATTQTSPADPAAAVPDVDIKVAPSEPLVRSTPYTTNPTSYRFTRDIRGTEALPAPPLPGLGSRATNSGNNEDIDGRQMNLISQVIKHYPQEDKFSGSAETMSLQYRLKDFFQHCTKLGLEQRYLMRVFPSMLTGDAREHFKTIDRPDLTWQEAVDSLTSKYETESQQRLRETEWRHMSLADVCNDEEGVPLPLSRNVLRLVSARGDPGDQALPAGGQVQWFRRNYEPPVSPERFFPALH